MVSKSNYLWKLNLFLVSTLFLTFFSGCGFLPMEEEVLAPPLVEPEQVTYKTEAVKRGYMEKSITVTGYFVPVKMEPHFFRHSSGRLKTFHVGYGDVVKEGDLLAELLTDSLENDITYQQFDVDAKTRSLEYYKEVSAMDLELAKQELAELESKYAAMKETPDLYSVEEINNIEDNIRKKQVDLQKLELNIQNQIFLKSNELEIAKMKLESLKQQLEKSRLYAKIDGRITFISRHVEGDYIDAFTTVAVISDERELQIEYNGREASNFKLGMQVEVTIGNEVYTGEVVMNPTSVPYEELDKYRETVRFTLDKIPEGVKRGDSARIKLMLEARDNTLMVPSNAVRLYMGNRIVYVLEDGIRVEKRVETGIEQGNMVEIIDGLTEGELVIID